MEESKREKLEAAEWKVGSVREFLNLSQAEARQVEIELIQREFIPDSAVAEKWLLSGDPTDLN